MPEKLVIAVRVTQPPGRATVFDGANHLSAASPALYVAPVELTAAELLAQAAAVHADFELSTVRCWLFAYAGLTAEAEALARQEGVFWSNREQLNGLLTYWGLRTLPTLTEGVGD